VVDPSERYDASRFAADAEKTIRELLLRDVAPLVVGGTGFYVLSLFEGLFEGPGRTPGIRARLEGDSERIGPHALHRRLSAVDPEAAERLHPNDTSRVIRALEVYEATGRPMTDWHDAGRRTPAFRPLYCVLTAARRLLNERIDLRVDRMMEEGLLEEVARLVESGALAAGMPASDAVGYSELLPVITGNRDLSEAVDEIKRNTRRYAKRQLTWFSRIRADVTIDMGTAPVNEAAEKVVGVWESRSA
jgi:tRNA dimethylallyltransferase